MRYITLLLLAGCTGQPVDKVCWNEMAITNCVPLSGPVLRVEDGGVRMPPMAHEMVKCGENICVR